MLARMVQVLIGIAFLCIMVNVSMFIQRTRLMRNFNRREHQEFLDILIGWGHTIGLIGGALMYGLKMDASAIRAGRLSRLVFVD